MGSDKNGGQDPWLGCQVLQKCKVAVNASRTWLWVGVESLSGLLNQSSRSSVSRDIATGPSLHNSGVWTCWHSCDLSRRLARSATY